VGFFITIQGFKPVNGGGVVKFQFAHIGDKEFQIDFVVFDEEDSHSALLHDGGVDGGAAVEMTVYRGWLGW